MNKEKYVFFDLDGTLLPMDQNNFVKAYFGLLAKKLAPYGYPSEKLINSIWKGTSNMVKNDGSRLNEDAFWESFYEDFGEMSKRDRTIFDDFYTNNFDEVAKSCGHTEKAKYIVDKAKAFGFKTVLATNPIFPTIATHKRIKWAGLDISDFIYITTYENSSHCKPNLNYYKDILSKLNISPEQCIMVGNDVGEDMVAEKLGMKVFLLTDCIINKESADISQHPHGSFSELEDFLENF